MASPESKHYDELSDELTLIEQHFAELAWGVVVDIPFQVEDNPNGTLSYRKVKKDWGIYVNTGNTGQAGWARVLTEGSLETKVAVTLHLGALFEAMEIAMREKTGGVQAAVARARAFRARLVDYPPKPV